MQARARPPSALPVRGRPLGGPRRERRLRPVPPAAASGPAGGDAGAAPSPLRLLSAAARWRSLQAARDEKMDEEDDEEEAEAEEAGAATTADEAQGVDDLVAKAAFELGGREEMNDAQRQYASKVAEALAAKAAELAARQRSQQGALREGQRLFERGRYAEAVAQLEGALEDAGQQTGLGGEVAIWLALALDAAGDHAGCVAMYLLLEGTHPSAARDPQAGRGAAVHRGGAEAGDPGGRAREHPAPGRGLRWRIRRQEWLENYQPPITTPNRFVLAATSVLCFSLAVYSAYHIRH